MAEIKSYTNIEQSKKLAEILPIESADMYFEPSAGFCTEPSEVKVGDIKYAHPRSVPCWSLAALFDVLPKYIGDYGKCLYFDMGYYYCGYMVDGDFMLSIEETSAETPIDACVEMIITLNELKLL